MVLLTHVSILILLACFSHHLMFASCQRRSRKRGRGEGGGKGRDGIGGSRASRPPEPVSPQTTRGEVVTKDKSRCTWSAAGQDLVTLSVACEKGERTFSCRLAARPSACRRYSSRAELYWRQINQALRRQKNLCRNGGAVVKAGVCRGAARDAHFRLVPPQAGPSADPRPARGAAKSCRRVNRELAEEFCADSWSSLCTLFFTMVQNDDC